MKLQALAYPGNLGFTEMYEFQMIATSEELQIMDKLLENEEWEKAIKLMEKVTGTKLERFSQNYIRLARIVRGQEEDLCKHYRDNLGGVCSISISETWTTRIPIIEYGIEKIIDGRVMGGSHSGGMDVCPFAGDPDREIYCKYYEK